MIVDADVMVENGWLAVSKCVEVPSRETITKT